MKPIDVRRRPVSFDSSSDEVKQGAFAAAAAAPDGDKLALLERGAHPAQHGPGLGAFEEVFRDIVESDDRGHVIACEFYHARDDFRPKPLYTDCADLTDCTDKANGWAS